jgi:glutamate-1-semialdehyde 2,1-aminomutase
MVERVTREIGAIFILDEVITFRSHTGGAQTLLGINPDLTTLAKIIGGGFPVGAVVGRREFMRIYDHRDGKPGLPWSGTFTANPVSMTAGKVTLDLLDKAAIDRMSRLNERLVGGLNKAFAKSCFPGQVTGFASSFKVFGHTRPITDYRSGYSAPQEAERVAALQRALTIAGFHIARNGKGFLSTPMTEADIDSFINAVSRIVDDEVWRKA